MQEESNAKVAPLSGSKEATNDKQSDLKKIYSWASKNTSETRELDDFKYYWSDATKNLLHILELSEGSIISLVGLSGVGKSSAQLQVARALNDKLANEGVVPKAVHFKWPGYLESNYGNILQLLKMQNVTASNQEIIKIIADTLATSRNSKVMKRRLEEAFGERLEESNLLNGTLERQDIENLLTNAIGKEPPIDAYDIAEKLFGPSEMKSLEKELVISLLSLCHTIMIDMRDYGLGDSRAMNTDISEIQRLWQLMNEHRYTVGAKRAPNLVCVLQKELLMSEDQTTVSYFLRKASQTVELLPLTPAQMIGVYREQFGDLYPFNQVALDLIGRYSRGVFRRFLRYIQLCLNWQLSNGRVNEIITREVVDQVLTEDEFRADLELEMRQIFPRGEYGSYAIRLLKLLYDATNKGVAPTLTELSEVIEYVSMSDLSRIIAKLEERGYIKRTKAPRGKVISANW